MIAGLEKFAAHFSGYRDRYILIGGAAMWLILDEAGMDPRATRDLDIVLCLEALDPEFGAAVWNFIKDGGYAASEKGSGGKSFYRFREPSQPGYPAMIELFARRPDMLPLRDNSRLTPLPISEEIASLSAILLDEGYYDFIHRHRRELAGVSIVGVEGLIPLKAYAWLDLTRRKAAGESIDARNIRKHRNDILRLCRVLPPEPVIKTPGTIRGGLNDFLAQIALEWTPDLLNSLGIRDLSPDKAVQIIRAAYGI